MNHCLGRHRGAKFVLSLQAAGEEGESKLDGGLSAVSSERTGWFRFYFDDQRWEWSREVQRLHGYEPGTVTPTTELVLSHKHPEDRDQVAETIEDITHNRGVFSSRHRIIDTDGRVRWVIVIGDQLCDDHGALIGTHGFYVDVTAVEQFREDMVTAKVGEVTEHRAAIERAKGMVMLIYDLEADAAFELLKWLSQEKNIKLRLLAERLCTDLRGAAAEGGIRSKQVFDHALMAAHENIANRVGSPSITAHNGHSVLGSRFMTTED
jgi:PAS domain S-box-containing protein